MALIKKIPDYQQGKIYKIINHELPNLIYYGSTTRTLNNRFSRHKNKYNNCSSKIMFSVGTPEIILLEEYPCETKQELEERERYYIEGNECVNHYIPCRTKKEYYEDNKEKLNEQSKQYKQDNKEKLKEARKIWDKKNIEKRRVYKREWTKNKRLQEKTISSNQLISDVVDGHQN